MARNRSSIRSSLAGSTGALVLIALLIASASSLAVGAQDSASSQTPSSSTGQATPAAAPRILPRGKKLMLTDGTFQLVREYRIEGDRVRYYSIDSSQWEQIPVAMVDWDATKKVEADEAKTDAALVAKVHKQEASRLAVPLDIDASLEVAPGIFLPPGDLLYVYDGKTVVPLPQAETDSKLSKGHFIEQVMVPIPLIPTRHSISIAGAHAKLRLTDGRPEFYIRVPNGTSPEMVLIRAKAHGDTRHVENVDQIFGEESEKRDAVPMQSWDIALGVYRFTLSQELASGEYAIAEMVKDGGDSLYVWDFGVDRSESPSASKQR
ncbi:MAG TPA: hypothetical protein VNV41_11845 [Candidatus Acidoferrales bacterium]|jgi:hypothetical protein|nr:hypothetical protein [Candidatus Acidoferrales bacterium]